MVKNGLKLPVDPKMTSNDLKTPQNDAKCPFPLNLPFQPPKPNIPKNHPSFHLPILDPVLLHVLFLLKTGYHAKPHDDKSEPYETCQTEVWNIG